MNEEFYDEKIVDLPDWYVSSKVNKIIYFIFKQLQLKIIVNVSL